MVKHQQSKHGGKHRLLEDSDSISSGGMAYVLPNAYRTSETSIPVKKKKKKKKKTPSSDSSVSGQSVISSSARSTTSRSSTVTHKTASSHSSHETYTSRVSNVSIKSRDPVLSPEDPLARDIARQIDHATGQQKGPSHLGAKLMSIQEDSPRGDLAMAEEGVRLRDDRASFVPPASIKLVLEGDGSSPGSSTKKSSKNKRKSSNGTRPRTSISKSEPPDTPPTLPATPPPPLSRHGSSSDTPKNYGGRGPRWSKRNRLLVIGAIGLLVIVGAVVGVIVALSGGGGNGDPIGPPSLESSTEPPASTPTISPGATDPPVSSPTVDDLIAELEVLTSSIGPLTASALDNTSSPQHQALLWLLEDVQANAWSVAANDDQILQRFALSTLFVSTLGGQWLDDAGWLDHTISECDWAGVNCISRTFADETGYRLIQGLSLPSNQLGGVLPPEISVFSGAVLLDFSNNQISGIIPDVFVGFNNLEVLRVDRNEFVGELPRSIGQVDSLSDIIFYNNNLAGNLGFLETGRLRSLHTLDGKDNRLTGALPEQLALSNRMRVLELSENSLGGLIPSQIGEMTLLMTLGLGKNSFVGSLPSELGRLQRLDTLDVYSNQLTGQIPNELGLLQNLLLLYLEENSLSGSLSSELGTLSNCVLFAAHDNQLTGPIPASFGGLVSVETILLQGNSLTSTIPATFRRLSNLEVLRIEDNNLGGNVPQGVCDLGASISADCLGSIPEIECTCCAECF